LKYLIELSNFGDTEPMLREISGCGGFASAMDE
jgi:hypothetical protein